MKNIWPKYLLLTTLFLLNLSYVKAQHVAPLPYFVKLDTLVENPWVPAQHLKVLEDPSNELSSEDVLARLDQFTDAHKRSPIAKRTYWILANLKAEGQADLQLFTGARGFYTTEMFYLDSLKSGIFQGRKNGRTIPAHEKDLKGFANYANPVKLYLPQGKSTQLLFKVYSPTNFYLPKQFKLFIGEQAIFRTERYFSNVVGAFMIGGVMIISLYHLCLFFFLKERVYLYFVGLTMSSAFFFLYYYGFSIEFAWPNSPFWDIYSFLFILATYSASLLHFSRLYMAIHQMHKIWLRLIHIIVGISLIPPIMVLPDFVMEEPSLNLLSWATELQKHLMLVVEIFTLVLSLVATTQKIPGARSFFFANMPPLIGSVILSLRFLDIIEHQDWMELAPQAGLLLMAILFSYGLGSKIIHMREEISLEQLKAEQLEREKESDKKRIIEQKNQELERKVLERTSQITLQKEEIASQKQAIQEQNQALQLINLEKNNLINIVAHDLKSPLNQIKGLMSVLKLSMKEIDQNQLSIIEMVSDSSNRLSKMITNLLDINAIELGKTNINKQPVSITLLCRKLQEQYTKVADKKDITLEAFNLSDDDLTIHTDRELLYQVLENLLSNAIKFSPHQKQIYIGATPNDQSVTIWIKDQGPGLTQEDQQKLFGKFQRLSAQPTGGEHSTGLGLSIVKRYIEALGGSVWCESEEGEGATFYVELPISS